MPQTLHEDTTKAAAAAKYEFMLKQTYRCINCRTEGCTYVPSMRAYACMNCGRVNKVRTRQADALRREFEC